MKLKTASIIAALVGAVILLFSVVFPILTLMNSDQGSVGIIGGADGPTAQFITFNLIAPYMLEICFGTALLIAGVFCLIFGKTVKANCSIKTTALSLGLSAAGGAGLYCLLIWAVIVWFDGASKQNPVAYLVSIICGLICLALFVFLMVWYIKIRKAIKSVKGIIIDVLTSILFLPTSFYLSIFILDFFA